jgi:hypothetical protein|nr:MAG TPA: hypothetical protein [Caudoviricetes sp.]
MTLDEAIEHARRDADRLERECKNSCAADHWQLTAWLEELRERRSKDN